MLPLDITRCRGDAADECRTCARQTAAQQRADWRTWWMVPPIARPCARRIEVEREEAAQ